MASTEDKFNDIMESFFGRSQGNLKHLYEAVKYLSVKQINTLAEIRLIAEKYNLEEIKSFIELYITECKSNRDTKLFIKALDKYSLSEEIGKLKMNVSDNEW